MSPLAKAAMHAPIVNRDSNFHLYNCHMAVIHWAWIAMGRTDPDAQLAVQKITREYCPHCAGESVLKTSLQNEAYGRIFCQGAIHLGDNPSAHQVNPGDVVFISDPQMPTHSMVVVEKAGSRIGIRGYNNPGTFADAGAPPSQYDPKTRRLDERTVFDRDVFLIKEWHFLWRVQDTFHRLPKL